ncbi:MAG: formate dehydrogenase [Burkholderiales bacterium 21-58-4]|nr:MAG: formate dehydrogenase [Burkholderiales bacterium 21-58-4]HQT25693.1 formate dehydrogenase subunit delta [Burkholderiales bacterium]
MDIENLVRMANRIGTFFEAMPDHEEAVRDVALHLAKFWDPRMRSELLRHFEESGSDGLRPIVIEAVSRHREMLS